MSRSSSSSLITAPTVSRPRSNPTTTYHPLELALASTLASGTPRASDVVVVPVVESRAGGGVGGDLLLRHYKPSASNYVLPMTTPTTTSTTDVDDNKGDKTILDVVFWELISVEFHVVISVVRDESEGGKSGITGREEGG